MCSMYYYIYTHIHTHTHTQIYIYIYIDTCTHTYTNTHMYNTKINFDIASRAYIGGCSAIAALSTKGVEMVSMHEDTVDSDTYLRVLEFEILPLMNAFPFEKSVLISDNAPVHNKAAIMTLCQSVGVLAIFLEPYSYDYNPIELVFHSAKDYLRHNWPADDHNFPVSKNFAHALFNCISGDTACNFFVHCHVNVTEEEIDRANDR